MTSPNPSNGTCNNGVPSHSGPCVCACYVEATDSYCGACATSAPLCANGTAPVCRDAAEGFTAYSNGTVINVNTLPQCEGVGDVDDQPLCSAEFDAFVNAIALALNISVANVIVSDVQCAVS